jgi:hypothetical protein
MSLPDESATRPGARCRFQPKRRTGTLVTVRCPVSRVIFVSVVIGLATAVDCGMAFAGGKLDARYTVTLGGVSFGKGAWHIDVGEDRFTSAVSGATAGVMRLFSSGKGSSAARGAVAGGQLVPATYTSSIETNRKYDEVRMVLQGGAVKEYIAEPPSPPNPDRVPLAEAHRRGVMDPMTASILPVPGNGSTFVPEACDRSIAVFDGRMRYDLKVAYKRLDKVKSDKGYQGTVVVCSVYFQPIAGHIPDRAVIKYLAELRDIELWLAPIAGTRLMVPYRASLSTPLGQGVMQATQFVSLPQTGNAVPNSRKAK